MLNVQFTMTPAGAAMITNPQPVEPDRKAKFNAEFVERRMRAHRELQEQMAAELEYDIVREVLLSSSERERRQ